MVKEVLKGGGKIDIRQFDGKTALLVAAEQGFLEFVEMLVRKGA